MKNLLLISFFISILAFAESHQGGPKILLTDPEADTTELEKSYTVEKAAPPPFAMPDLNERDRFFEGVIFPESWDELKKDIFFMELKSKTFEDLVKKYPDLKKSDIHKLKGKK